VLAVDAVRGVVRSSAGKAARSTGPAGGRSAASGARNTRVAPTSS
jgi:hypothetical protein